jgi:prophage regulatory protein
MSHKILRLPEVIAKTGIARSTIYTKIAERQFPQPIQLGSRSVGWLETEIDQWVSQRISASRPELVIQQ